MPAPGPLPCVIVGADEPTVRTLAGIAKACARDLGVSLVLQTAVERMRTRKSASDPVLTLHLPVELAASQHQVWCLACRLACFCPAARISVLVLGQVFSTSSSLVEPDGQCSA
ncbi:MAG: hypothetical protein WDM96_10645 [Lacunisphaera sp.]